MTNPARRTSRFVIDRFEGDFAAVELEGGRMVDLPAWMIPVGARPGDVVRVQHETGPEGNAVRLTLDPGATAAGRKEAETRLRRLRRRDPGGDLEG